MATLKTSLEANYETRRTENATYRGTSYRSAQKLKLAIIILSCLLAAGKALLKNINCHIILQLGKQAQSADRCVRVEFLAFISAIFLHFWHLYIFFLFFFVFFLHFLNFFLTFPNFPVILSLHF